MTTNLIEAIPAIRAQQPANVSDRYTFIPTEKVIDDLGSLGWNAVAFCGSDKNDAARHVVRFRQANLPAKLEEFPEIVLLNSHNGLSSFQLKAGIFRLVCSNGLVVCSALFKEIRIKHINYSLPEVQSAVSKFADGLPSVLDSVDRMKRVFLSPADAHAFAQAAVAIRFPDGTPVPVNLDHALRPRRAADESRSVWSVMNILQEKVMKGQLRTDRGRHLRAIKEPKRVVDFNQQLFDLALKFAHN